VFCNAVAAEFLSERISGFFFACSYWLSVWQAVWQAVWQDFQVSAIGNEDARLIASAPMEVAAEIVDLYRTL
jgi:hypothetical protein